MLTSSPLGASYPVALPVFEGPLDLLLQLIERQELEISAISLVAVTDSYLRTIEQIEAIDPGALADFLMVASRLLYIKSRALLPLPRVDDAEEDEEPADALVRQLLEYRLFKQAATQLRQREEQHLRTYIRTGAPPEMERRIEIAEITLEQLQSALRRVLARMPQEAPLPRVKTYAVTVAEQIDYVRDLLRRRLAHFGNRQIRFSALLQSLGSRLEVIVTFLAVLELIKMQEIVVEQEDLFGEIILAQADPAHEPTTSLAEAPADVPLT